MKNYYEILEVSPKSSKEIIEKAYKVLSEKYYPKSYKGADKLFAQEKFLEINEAYKILSDTFLREQYDAELNKQIAEEQIENYNRLYRNSRRKDAFEEKQEIKYEQVQEEKSKPGTPMAMLDILKQIFIDRPKRNKKEKIKKEDITAGIITAVIVIVLGIILWLIPATRGFIRDIIPF